MSATAIKNMFEAGYRFNMSSTDLMCAAIAYHNTAKKLDVHDPYYRNILAAGALCAHFGVIHKELDLESVVAVYYEIIYRQNAVENMEKSEYKYLRQHIPMTSKCVAWVLGHAKLNENPMNYLVSYLRTAQFSIGFKDIQKIPLVRDLAWIILQSLVQDEVCIKYRADYIALTVLYLAIVKESPDIISAKNLKESMPWIQKLIPDFEQDVLHNIIGDIRKGLSSFSLKAQPRID